MSRVIYLKQVKDKLDSVSPTMCLAKWTQTTIYLNSGSTHSCHHPGVHQIPTDGLDENPGMIHNTPRKQQLRHQMLEGQRPSECDYCWRIEDLPGEHTSDRIFKSSMPWSMDHFQEVFESGSGPDFAPRYLEVLFDSTCNFACSYCMPEVSSKIWADIHQHGPYMLSEGRAHNMIGGVRDTTKLTLQKADVNPYIEAFWKIIPEWWPKLNTFRITGGEPLLSKHTWSMMDFVEQNANKELSFAVNSNLGVPDDKIDLLIKRINDIQPNLKSMEVYTSIESTGKQAEYIRNGMDYEKYMANVEKVLANTNAKLVVMTTINALCYSTFVDFVNEFLKLRAKYKNRLDLSFNYLRHPTFMDAKYLPQELKVKWSMGLASIVHSGKLQEHERDQLSRFVEYLRVTPDAADQQRQHTDLALYVKQFDERRGLDFPNTFPELHKHLPKV